jgi:hypothetical protein
MSGQLDQIKQTKQTIEEFITKHQITIETRFKEFTTEPAREKDKKGWDHFAWEVTLKRPPVDGERCFHFEESAAGQLLTVMKAIPWRAGAAHLEYYHAPSKEWRKHQRLGLGFYKGKLHATWREGSKTHYIAITASPNSITGGVWKVQEAGAARVSMEKAGIKWGEYALLQLRPEAPTVAEVLDCLASDATTYDNRASFAEFCADYGYNDDSIRDKEVYERVVESGRKLAEWLGREAFEELLYSVERL